MTTNQKVSQHQKKLNKYRLVRRRLAFLGFHFLTIPAIAACVNPTQTISQISQPLEQATMTNNYKIARHTENYSKPPKSELPVSIDTKYSSLTPSESNSDSWQYAIDPALIPQGRAYRQRIAALTEKDIRDDIHDSLLEVMENNRNIFIDFETLKLNFLLTKQSSVTTFINSFLLEFNITNNAFVPFDLFGSISIAPQSTVALTISLFEGVITPDYSVTSNGNGLPNSYAASWSIAAKSYNFVVTMEAIAGITAGNKINYNPKQINFITSRSYAINTFYLGFSSGANYEFLRQKVGRTLFEMKPSDYKKDVNDWFTQYFRLQASLGFQDVEKIMRFLITPSVGDNTGKLQSPLHIFLTDKVKRDEILDSTLHNQLIRRILDAILDTHDGKRTLPSTESVSAWIQQILDLNLSDYFDKNLRIEVQWIHDPQLFISDLENPQISYEFKVKVTFLKDLMINFVGSHQFNGQNQSFDLNKLFDFSAIIKSLSQGEESTNSNTNLFLTNFANFLMFNTIGVKANESVSLTFKSLHSPLDLSINSTLDVRKAQNVNLGWQASDSSMTIDLSQIPTFWEKIYHKMNQINHSGTNQGANAAVGAQYVLGKLHDRFDKGDSSALFEILSYLFVHDSDRSKVNQPNHPARPVEVLFKNLVEKQFLIKSVPMVVNLSRAFYHLPDTFNNQPLWNPVADKLETFVNNPHLSQRALIPTLSYNIEEKVGDLQEDQYKNQNNFNLLWKNPEFFDITNAFLYYGISAQTSVYKYEAANAQIDALLEGVKTNDELYSLEPQIRQIVKDNFINNSGKEFNPEVSIVKITLGEAVRSVFRMPVKASVQELAKIAIFFGKTEYNIAALADDLVQLDPHVVLINMKVPNFFLSENNSGVYGDWASNITTKFVAPIIDASKIKI
ncbi:hypothetical protein J2Z62_000119 [Mycoplasmoides fastidiosum]|uniref:Lipoprotein n=1 Tax=Mycoplasmoides fastidiosum TaxID=92758 RepID=A0ABU0LY90_9BACT|nr:hypothetical protein [Mycoplasmoides fastidiosum]MDQ0513681.1 hypothetical protein [Mycoplasmoides fastidiosum]UUD37900.1 hypothetical protein NPA10_00685 [Mycoplasmoides fastidiosum]